MSKRDEDMRSKHLLEPLEGDYRTIAWPNFHNAQIVSFRPVQAYLGLGNHELLGGKKRKDYFDTFKGYLPGQGLHAPAGKQSEIGRLPLGCGHSRLHLPGQYLNEEVRC